MLVYGPYRATVVTVLDTAVRKLEVAICPGRSEQVELRIDGVRTPRADSPCEAERLLAEDAGQLTQTFVGDAVVVSAVRKAQRGEWFSGGVKNQRGVDLGSALLSAGCAVATKKNEERNPWCS